MSVARIRALLDEGLERGFFAGVAAAVAFDDGAIERFVSGQARLVPAPADATKETLWDLASLTKPLAGAALALALRDAGAFSLDDSVARFDDAFKKTRFDGVTLRRLLTHTAGLRAWFPCYVRGEGRAAYRRTLVEVDAAGPPGRAVLYSDLGFLLLGDVIERVASEPIDALFRRLVSEPLGLAPDLLYTPVRKDAERAAGGERDDATERALVLDLKLRYAGFREGFVNGEANDGNAYRRAGGVSLNAGLFGTLDAVTSLGLAWLRRDRRLLAEASIVEATTRGSLAPEAGSEPTDRGLGWQMATPQNAAGPSLSPESYGHTGFTGTSIFVDPQAKRVYVLLANRLHPEARTGDLNDLRQRFHTLAAGL